MISLKRDIPEQARYWRNNKAIYRYSGQPIEIDEASHNRWLDKISLDPTIEMFGIEANDEGGALNQVFYVGVCGFTNIDKTHQSAEFNIYIAREFQGKGYGKEALKKLFQIGFYDLNLNRIYGRTFETNQPAAILFAKLGMEREGTLRQAYFKDGKFIDAHIYGLLRQDARQFL